MNSFAIKMAQAQAQAQFQQFKIDASRIVVR